MARRPPILAAYREVAAWNASGATRSTSAAVPWSADSAVVTLAGAESNQTLPLPTATGLTFNPLALNSAASSCATRAAWARAGASGSQTVSMAPPTTTQMSGIAAWVFDGSDGIGTVGEQHTATHTVSLTPKDERSAWLIAVFDFSAAVVTGNSIAPTVSTSRQKVAFNPNWSVYVGDINTLASVASTAFGLTAGGTAGTLSILAVEVLGTTVKRSPRGSVAAHHAATWCRRRASGILVPGLWLPTPVGA